MEGRKGMKSALSPPTLEVRALWRQKNRRLSFRTHGGPALVVANVNQLLVERARIETCASKTLPNRKKKIRKEKVKFSNNSVCVSVLCAPPFLLRPSTIFWTPSSGPPSIPADYYSDRHTELCHKTFQFSLSLSKGKRNKKTRTIFFFLVLSLLLLLLLWGGLKLPDSG